MTFNTKQLAIALAAISIASLSSAYQLNTYSLNTNADPDASTDWFSVSFESNSSGASFTLANLDADINNSTSISDIYIGNTCGLSGTEGFCSIFDINSGVMTYDGEMKYSIDTSPTGGSQIKDWGIALKEDAKGGSAKSVIDTGESLTTTFSFVDGSTFSESDIAQAFEDLVLGMAFHVQRIEGDFSEWYGTSTSTTIEVPEPATLGLLGLGIAGLASARRKKAS